MGGFTTTITSGSLYFKSISKSVSVPLLFLCKINYVSGNKWVWLDLSPCVFFSCFFHYTHHYPLPKKFLVADDHSSCIANLGLILKWHIQHSEILFLHHETVHFKCTFYCGSQVPIAAEGWYLIHSFVLNIRIHPVPVTLHSMTILLSLQDITG